MQTYGSVFAFILLGWSAGFASSVILHFISFMWSVRHVEEHLS